MAEQAIHQGRNIKRLREMFGIKQEALALNLGDDWTQKKISQLESKAEIDAELLEKVAQVLKVPADAIRNFSEEAAINIISSTLSFDNYSQQQVGNNNHCTINPIEKWIAAIEKNEQLYERLVKAEADKVAVMQQLIDQLKK